MKSFLSNCTLLVSSCDAYDDLWYPFFKILKDEWNGFNLPIVLNTESKDFEFEGLNITTMQLAKKYGHLKWGKRMRLTVEKIQTDYILFMLDDFFLREEVCQERIENCYRWMNEDKNIAVFYFMPTWSRNKKSNKYSGFEKMPLFAPYKFNCQAALWRKSDLLRSMRDFENPWQWEAYGTWRSFRQVNKEYYSICEGTKEIISYTYSVDGYTWGGLAVYRGKWYVPCAKAVLEKHGIDVDFSKRGTVDKSAFVPRKPKTKEDYFGIKRKLFFLYKPYVRFMKLIDTIKHIRHLF